MSALEEAMRRLLASDLLPKRAGQPVKALVHIYFAELLEMDPDSALQDTWIEIGYLTGKGLPAGWPGANDRPRGPGRQAHLQPRPGQPRRPSATVQPEMVSATTPSRPPRCLPHVPFAAGSADFAAATKPPIRQRGTHGVADQP
jgi:hypothetical protein